MQSPCKAHSRHDDTLSVRTGIICHFLPLTGNERFIQPRYESFHT
jgi:hypothetical protein